MIAALTPFLLMLGPVALLVAMGIVFAETGLLVGFFLPGDSLLFTLGVLAAGGLLHLPLGVVAVSVAVAAVAGDQVGYLLGRRYGPRIFSRPESRWFSRRHADRARAFFDKHGPKAVVVARFLPVVRTFTPVVAGVAQMPRGRFTAYNVAGGLAWTLGLLTVGFYLGGIPLIAAHIELFALGMAFLSLVPALVGVVRHRSAPRDAAAPPAQLVEPAEPKVPVGAP